MLGHEGLGFGLGACVLDLADVFFGFSGMIVWGWGLMGLGCDCWV